MKCVLSKLSANDVNIKLNIIKINAFLLASRQIWLFANLNFFAYKEKSINNRASM